MTLIFLNRAILTCYHALIWWNSPVFRQFRMENLTVIQRGESYEKTETDTRAVFRWEKFTESVWNAVTALAILDAHFMVAFDMNVKVQYRGIKHDVGRVAPKVCAGVEWEPRLLDATFWPLFRGRNKHQSPLLGNYQLIQEKPLQKCPERNVVSLLKYRTYINRGERIWTSDLLTPRNTKYPFFLSVIYLF